MHTFQPRTSAREQGAAESTVRQRKRSREDSERTTDPSPTHDLTNLPIHQERPSSETRSGGRVIPRKIRARMERRLNTDLSSVTIHPDSPKASAVDAVAYTQGDHIHFAPGTFRPETSSGMRVLGHEVAHVIQQRQRRVAPTGRINGQPLNDNPSLEREADRVGSMVADGGSSAAHIGTSAEAAPGGASAPLQCLRSVAQFQEGTFGNWPRRKSINAIDTALQAAIDAAPNEKLAKLDELREAIQKYLDDKEKNDPKNGRIPPVRELRDEVDAEYQAIMEDQLMNQNKALDPDKLNAEFGYARTPQQQERLERLRRRNKQIGQSGQIDIGAKNEKLTVPAVADLDTKIDRVKAAETSIESIKSKYGIDVDSAKGVKGVKEFNSQAAQGVKSQVKESTWSPRLLGAVEKGLSHFAPILGDNRAQSTRHGHDQEVTSISRVQQAIHENSPQGALKASIHGQQFPGQWKNVTFYDRIEDGEPDAKYFDPDMAREEPPDLADQMELTVIHEMTHGLLNYALADYVNALDYWADDSTPSGNVGAEKPITKYGEKDANEDLSEAVKYYFKYPQKLRSKCPRRFAFIKKTVEAWTPRN